MTQNTTNPSEEVSGVVLNQVFPEKEAIPELFVSDEGDKHGFTISFNGSFRFRGDAVKVRDNHAIPEVPFYGTSANALITSNKRFLEKHDIFTDYMPPNPLLARALGFSEAEALNMEYVLDLIPMPFKLVVTGYDEFTGKYLSATEVTPCLLDGLRCRINSDDAITMLADYLLDNDVPLTQFDLMDSFDNLDKAHEILELSEEAKAYGESGNPDDPWEALEFSLAYELAKEYFQSMVAIAGEAYFLLQERYLASNFILARTEFTFGIDDEEKVIYITDEVGTVNNSLIVNAEDYKCDADFVQAHTKPLAEWLKTVKFEGEDDPILVIPSELLSAVADEISYITEALADDTAYELYLS